MSGITTHVLDTARGQPVAGLGVRLAVRAGGGWTELATARTDASGRVAAFAPAVARQVNGVYRLVFDVGEYFKKQGVSGFYPYVEIVFEARGDEHYHVPLLVSPFGYSTYRGS